MTDEQCELVLKWRDGDDGALAAILDGLAPDERQTMWVMLYKWAALRKKWKDSEEITR